MMLLPRRRYVFVDTGAFAALSLERDEDHRSALAISRRLASAGLNLVTTNFVVAETHSLVLARAGRAIALQTLEEIESRSRTIIRIDEDHELRARQIITRYRDKDFTLVDAMSFAAMERMGLSLAFAFDHHFSRFGFQLAT